MNHDGESTTCYPRTLWLHERFLIFRSRCSDCLTLSRIGGERLSCRACGENWLLRSLNCWLLSRLSACWSRCCCPLCKWPARRHGGRNAATTSSRLALLCKIITIRYERSRQGGCG